jgi:hypothetical protein
MNHLKILLRDETKSFRPGDVVDGVAGWQSTEPLRSVELRLFWFTRGKGTEDVGLVNRIRFESPQMEEGRRFRFILPTQPWSFSGELVSLIWALELVAEPGHQSTRAELTVSPTGQEILLHRHARP